MAISENNKRVIITIPKELHDKIKEIADKDNRSISNYIVTEIKKIIEKP